jgi:4-alpha-glucanotransferase
VPELDANPDPVLDPVLAELAAAYSIATEYWDWRGRHVAVAPKTIVDVLAGLGVDAATPDAAARALGEQAQRPWTRMLPPCLALRQGRTASVWVHVTHGDPVQTWIELETGEIRNSLRQLENWASPWDLGGRWVGEASFEIPADLPLGYHTLHARSLDATARMPLIITPAWLGLPERMGSRRGWGFAAQLYSVRSRDSWAVGDLSDLEDLMVWSAAEHGADYLLINPLHAAEPGAPMEPSPYLPSSRRFANPLYLRPERIVEYATASDAQRARVRAHRAELDGRPNLVERIDRDASWAAKRAALKVIFAVPRTQGREEALAAYRRREGQGLTDFATWAVLWETYGADPTSWPDDVRHPGGPGVAAFRAAHAAEIDFHCWLQWVLDEQLAAAQAAGVQAGMSLGVMADLAVGVSRLGADAWALQDVFAQAISVGAPPDPYNQNGQNWNQPPWRPDRLADAAYEPFRQLVSTVLRHAGGIRVDHVIGLFRLWWIPDGARPTEGTYVRYDHEALIGILALEAQRAGAVVVGEDLGTVEPWVRTYLRERGILGTSILWFEFDYEAHRSGDAPPLAPERWREYCLASVTTHDLPPTAGYLAGDHVRLRDELGVLTRSVAEELAADEADRRAWLDNLTWRWALPPDADEEQTVQALHRYLTWTPCRLLGVALTDAVGDRKIQNQPGTKDEYPNWRIPLSGPDGRPLTLDDVFASERAAALLRIIAS